MKYQASSQARILRQFNFSYFIFDLSFVSARGVCRNNEK